MQNKIQNEICICGHDRLEHDKYGCYHISGKTTHYYCFCKNFTPKKDNNHSPQTRSKSVRGGRGQSDSGSRNGIITDKGQHRQGTHKPSLTLPVDTEPDEPRASEKNDAVSRIDGSKEPLKASRRNPATTRGGSLTSNNSQDDGCQRYTAGTGESLNRKNNALDALRGSNSNDVITKIHNKTERRWKEDES